MGSSARDTGPWSDRFSRPTVEALIQSLGRQAGAAFNRASARAIALGLREELHWCGVPWRWCMAYWAEDGAERASVFLIPEPGRPRCAVPLTPEALADIQLKNLPRAVREGIVHAPTVGVTRWCQWGIETKGAVDEVFALVEVKAIPAPAPGGA